MYKSFLYNTFSSAQFKNEIKNFICFFLIYAVYSKLFNLSMETHNIFSFSLAGCKSVMDKYKLITVKLKEKRI